MDGIAGYLLLAVPIGLGGSALMDVWGLLLRRPRSTTHYSAGRSDTSHGADSSMSASPTPRRARGAAARLAGS